MKSKSMLLFFYKKQLEVALGALLGFLVSAVVYIAQFNLCYYHPFKNNFSYHVNFFYIYTVPSMN